MVSGIRSAELKLARAAKHLRAIKRCLTEYAASQPHKVTTKAKGKKKLNIPKPPPRQISILAGEMVYQMRSALDHLAFNIIKLNPNIATVDPKWREHCQFPIRTTLPKNCTPPLAKRNFSSDLPGISDEAFTIIERMQPYYGDRTQPFYRSNAINNCLRFLAHLSNIDKHRHLNLIRARVRQFQYIKRASGAVTGRWKMFDPGAIIEPPRDRDESDRPVYVNRRYRTLVAFNEREHLGDATTVPIDVLLGLIHYHIDVLVFPQLRQLIKNR